MGKIALYYYTMKNMKPGQVFNRLRIKLGKGCPLGVSPSGDITGIQKIESPESLDFDPIFLARFPVKELMGNSISILHSSKEFDWKSRWEFDDKPALWNFNLHYFEYLFPLVKVWKDTGNKRYLDKTVEMIEGWIDNNPIGTSPAWVPYTMALRMVTWISYFGYVEEALEPAFRKKLLMSLHNQYIFLVGHLEKDIFGNHYFEDLKSLVLGSIFFKDEDVLNKALTDFKAECKEEILPDGMHFELSPMYHKIILEGMLRVAIALRDAGKQDTEIESYLQPMLDVAYSFENGLERIPLFNDSGNNVAKSLDTMKKTAQNYFNLCPSFQRKFEASGYYIFEKITDSHNWKLIVDAGQPGPKYIPGHAHCDAMSFELFCDGKPVVVNCGTYAYQCKERSFFRSTAAHNTVMVEGTEQSQCWGAFRLAKRSSTRVLDVTDHSITMEMTDQKGQKIQRVICFNANGLNIKDFANYPLTSFIHIAPCGRKEAVNSSGNNSEEFLTPYAMDYGVVDVISALKMTSEKWLDVNVDFEKLIKK